MTKKQKNPKALILTADKFEDLELFYPVLRLFEAGVEVDIVGPVKGPVHGEYGYEVNIGKTFDDVNSDDYDLLILPGGLPNGAPKTVSKSPKAQNIAREFFKADKPVAAICHGPYTLIAADLLKGKHATGFWGDGVPEEMQGAGAVYEDKAVVVDGNLITSRYPMDLPAFMREVMKKLKTE